MAEHPDRWRLKRQLQRDVERMEDAERKGPSALAQTAMLGGLVLMMVIPVVVGAYLGRWVDRTWSDGDGHWTLGLIIAGAVVGAMNVYLYLRE